MTDHNHWILKLYREMYEGHSTIYHPPPSAELLKKYSGTILTDDFRGKFSREIVIVPQLIVPTQVSMENNYG